MIRIVPALLAVLVAIPARAGGFVEGALLVDGMRVAVTWNDGDSFRFNDGPMTGERARLSDVNALESYGPVHRWGSWSRWELYQLSQRSAYVCASQAWSCSTVGHADRFGRHLVRCPGLAKELVRLGHAMVFAVDEPPCSELVATQRDAQRRGAGMWKKGVPPRIVSGAHAANEFSEGSKAYERIVDTATGKADAVAHSRTYETCEEVCTGEGAEKACLVYVPFRRRYHDPPPCLTEAAAASSPAR
jgi:micrococcal nuclease